MKKNFINSTHIEGFVYDHTLELRKSSEQSKKPGTEFIMGTLSVAVDNALTNIIPVHFTYVTETTASGKTNATFQTLKDIINGTIGNITKHGAANAGRVRIDSAIGLNDFYSNRTGTEELVSVRRNEGGFVHSVNQISENEDTRNTFTADMIITGVVRSEGDTPRAEIKGCIFDFRKAILPMSFTITNERGIDYFESLDASPTNPVFTKVWGHQVQTVVKKTTENTDSGWGEVNLQETNAPRREWIISGSNPETYEWNTEETITAEELKAAMADRERYLAEIKRRQEEYQANKSAPASAFLTATNNTGVFKF